MCSFLHRKKNLYPLRKQRAFYIYRSNWVVYSLMVPCVFITGGGGDPDLLPTHEQGLVPVGVVTLRDSLSVQSIPTDFGKSKFLCKVVAHRVSVLQCSYWFFNICVRDFNKIFNHNLKGCKTYILIIKDMFSPWGEYPRTETIRYI